MAFHGGLLGATVGMALFARGYQAPPLTVFDIAAAGAIAADAWHADRDAFHAALDRELEAV